MFEMDSYVGVDVLGLTFMKGDKVRAPLLITSPDQHHLTRSVITVAGDLVLGLPNLGQNRAGVVTTVC